MECPYWKGLLARSWCPTNLASTDFVIRVQAEPPRSAHLPQMSISSENFDRIVGLTAEVIHLPDVESACVDRSIAEQ